MAVDFFPAEYGTASFFVSRTDTDVGRRTIVHEFPLRDVPFVEDLGRAARVFTIDGFTLGDNWITDLDKLIQAVEYPGASTLMHPVYGAVLVKPVEKLTVTQFLREKRRANFRLVCVEQRNADDWELSRPIEDAEAVNDLGEQIRENLAEVVNQKRFLPIGAEQVEVAVPRFTGVICIEPVTLRLNLNLGRFLRFLREQIGNAVNMVWDTWDAVLSFFTELDNTLAALVTDAAYFALRITDLFERIDSIATDIKEGRVPQFAVVRAIENFCRLTGSELNLGTEDLPDDATNTNTQNEANDDTLLLVFRTQATIAYSKFLLEVEWPSSNDLDFWVERYSETMDLAIVLASDQGLDDLAQLLTQLRQKTIDLLNNEFPTLADLRPLVVDVPTSALVTAYDLYDDIEREEEILLRNLDVPHPGFMEGVTLEVLSR